MATTTNKTLSPSSFDKLYINGEYVESCSGERIVVRNPKDNTIVAENVPIAGQADVDVAVTHAEAAFTGPWRSFSAAQRSACFLKLVDILEDRLNDILTLDSLTTGNPVSLIPTREKNYIKSCLMYYCGLIAIPHPVPKSLANQGLSRMDGQAKRRLFPG